MPKDAKEYAREALAAALARAGGQRPRLAPGDVLDIVTAAISNALADARALPGAMAPPDVEAIRERAAGAGRKATKLEDPAGWFVGAYARDVPALLIWSDYLAGWVHDLLTDRGAYDARREGEAAGLRRAAAEMAEVRFKYWHQSGDAAAALKEQASNLRALADSLDAGPPPPPARLQADLAACRAALAGLLRVLETEEGDDPMAINRALAEARWALREEPR